MIVWKIFYDVFEDCPITNIGKHVFVMPKASLDNRAYVMVFYCTECTLSASIFYDAF